VIVRGREGLAEAEELWRRVAWAGEQAEYEHFTAALADAEPLALFVLDGGEPAAAAAGRLRPRRLDTAIGYVRLFAPTVRALELVAGGVVARDDEAARALAGEAWSALRGSAADALLVPALPVDSPAFRALVALGGPLERQRFIPTWTRRTLVLPETFDAFLASRSRKTRSGIRYDAKKLEYALGDVGVAVHRDASQLDRLVADLESVARSTYQRALGAGFADTPEQRELLRVDLEHGWARVYVLSHAGRAIAYWLCSTHRRTITTRSTGYRADYARHRPGIYLLMRVIADACEDPSLDVLDFGPGRSDYKRHFSSDGYDERNIVVYAPHLRPRAINVARTAALGAGAGARRALDATGLTVRLKTAWRARLRGGT
jgi:CelD/BcsL family acetyltransferase involved in cellulose biosynthesis